MNRDRIYLLLYSLILFLIFLWNVPLLDPDEPVYGETAKEMIAAGDWLSPRIYGDFWYDKPPLFYWLEAVSFSLLGVSTFSARLPSALIAAGTVLYVYGTAERLFSRRIAFTGAFILASSLEFIVIARAAVTDMTLTAALTAALFSFLEKRYAAAYIACGFALLAKGPIGFGFPAFIVGLWLLAQKRFTWKPIMALRWYWGIPLACLVGLPWYAYMVSVHGQPFVDTFLGYHNLVRFTQPEHAGKDHWWLYFVVLTAGFFPWTGALAGALTRVRRFAADPKTLYLMVWAGFIFLFFSASSTQLFSYILPIFPPLAVLSALYLDDLAQEGAGRLFPQLHIFFLGITAAAVAAAPLTPAGGLPAKYGTALVSAGRAGALSHLRRVDALRGARAGAVHIAPPLHARRRDGTAGRDGALDRPLLSSGFRVLSRSLRAAHAGSHEARRFDPRPGGSSRPEKSRPRLVSGSAGRMADRLADGHGAPPPILISVFLRSTR